MHFWSSHCNDSLRPVDVLFFAFSLEVQHRIDVHDWQLLSRPTMMSSRRKISLLFSCSIVLCVCDFSVIHSSLSFPSSSSSFFFFDSIGKDLYKKKSLYSEVFFSSSTMPNFSFLFYESWGKVEGHIDREHVHFQMQTNRWHWCR